MFGPGWSAGCPSCSYIADHFAGMMPHLNARDVTLAAVSRAPWPELEAFQRRMGWKFNWVSSAGSDFNYDYHVSFKPEEIASGDLYYNYQEMPGTPAEDLPGLSAFFRDADGQIYHTYSSYARGLDMLVGAYNFLDVAPLGRNEEGLAFSMAWVRHHDRYDENYTVDPLAGYAPPKGLVLLLRQCLELYARFHHVSPHSLIIQGTAPDLWANPSSTGNSGRRTPPPSPSSTRTFSPGRSKTTRR